MKTNASQDTTGSFDTFFYLSETIFNFAKKKSLYIWTVNNSIKQICVTTHVKYFSPLNKSFFKSKKIV